MHRFYYNLHIYLLISILCNILRLLESFAHCLLHNFSFLLSYMNINYTYQVGRTFRYIFIYFKNGIEMKNCDLKPRCFTVDFIHRSTILAWLYLKIQFFPLLNFFIIVDVMLLKKHILKKSL